MPLSLTTRHPNGVTNSDRRQTLGNAGFPDPTFAAIIALDYINATDVTALAAAGGTVAASAGLGGVSTLTTGAVAAAPGVAATPLVFSTTLNRRIFAKWKGSLDSLLGTLLFGFAASTAAGAQGVYITSTTAGVLSLVVSGPAGVTTVPFPTNLPLAAGVMVELGLEIDNQGNCFAFYNPGTGATPNQNIAASGLVADGPVASAYYQLNGALTGLSVPIVPLLGVYGATPTTAVARVLTTDFFVAAQHR